MLHDDLTLQGYAEEYHLRINDSKAEPKSFFRRFEGSCPEDWGNCQSHVTRIFLKHDETLSAEVVRAQVYKHAQYMTQLLQSYVDESSLLEVVKEQSGGDKIQAFNAGYRAAEAELQINLIMNSNALSSSKEVTFMDGPQMEFFTKEMLSFLADSMPSTNLAVVYDTTIMEQKVTGGPNRRRQLRRDSLRDLADDEGELVELQISGYVRGAQFALAESRDEFAGHIENVLQLDGSTVFLDQIHFDANLPGGNMEYNQRHLLFQQVTALDSSLDSNFAIPIPWAEGREKPDEYANSVGGGSDDGSSMDPIIIYILVPFLILLFLGGLGMACLLHQRHKVEKKQRKELDKELGIDQHDEY
mmetsp:Transcript_23376/g.48550  ORF Transcript_23376/g.48550 Transcript_23376/m.48550 type:complete len:358 (-) Transcript_23376:414-1487(-)